MSTPATFALLLRGFSSVALQTLLLRELLIVFHGSELTFGLMLCVWLISGALGSMQAARFSEKSPQAAPSYAFLQMVFACVAPLAVVFIRLSRALLRIPFADALSPAHIVLIIFLALALPALADGIMFTLGFRLLSSSPAPPREAKSPMAKMYLLESLGVMAGGLCFTFILLPVFHSFQTTLLLSSLQCFSARLLLDKTTRSKLPIIATAALLAALTLLASSDVLQRWTLVRQWHKKNLIAYQNSAFGNIAVTKEYSQFTVFYDGLPALSAPSPDIYFTEDFIHLPLSAKPEAHNILFIGTAVGGLLEETLKYPAEHITYVEPDPVFLKIVSSLDDPVIRRECQNARLRFEFADGRRFVSGTKNRYDAVFVNTGLPTSLALNRYATKEFFQKIKDILTDDGMAVFKTWGALSALSRELKDVNACMIKTLENVFAHVEVIPGDGFNIFLASPRPFPLDTETMSKNLTRWNIRTAIVNPPYLRLRLNRSYADWFGETIKDALKEAPLNEDLHPAGLTAGLRLYYSQFSKRIPRWFGGFKKINAGVLACGIVLLAGLIGWRIRRRNTAGPLLEATVSTTGFAAMSIQFIVLFLFQSYLGYLYQWLAILTASFMAGACAGTLGALKKPAGPNGLKKLSALETLVPAAALLLLAATIFLMDQKAAEVSFLRWLFPAASAVGGFLVGIEFPLVYELIRAAGGNPAESGGRLAGRLYGLDLIGACCGALLTPLVLIPSCGILPTLSLLVLLKISNSVNIFLFQLLRRV